MIYKKKKNDKLKKLIKLQLCIENGISFNGSDCFDFLTGSVLR